MNIQRQHWEKISIVWSRFTMSLIKWVIYDLECNLLLLLLNIPKKNIKCVIPIHNVSDLTNDDDKIYDLESNSLLCSWRRMKHWSQTRASWFFRYSRQCLLEEHAWHTTWQGDHSS